MTEIKMMDEIVCPCTKCKLELNHRITRIDKGQPKKVLCLTCKTEHVYRAQLTSTKKSPRTIKARKTASDTPSRADQEIQWREKLDKGEKTAKPYGMDKAFSLDDFIQHPLFGRGLIVNVTPPSKIDVFFQDGLKTLKCASVG